MSYAVKEIFYTLQGEGYNTGRPSVFCRLAGCNLWTGREEDRSNAVCQFCDTDFIGTNGTGGGRFGSVTELVQAIQSAWPNSKNGKPLVVCTGGEPLLQLDGTLVQTLQKAGFEIAIETNGTLPAPAGINWICVSPKAGTDLVVRRGHELKLIYPQADAAPEAFVDLDFERFSLQPMDGPDIIENTARAVDYCLSHPQWRLSLQTHKTLGIR